jgi:TATA-binding protein-associated factor Taf7
MTKGDHTILPDDEIIDEVVKEIENQDEEDEADLNKMLEEGDEDDEELGEEDEDDDDDGMDNGMEELDPQVIKLQERIKFLRHRCVSRLGNNIFEKAFGFLKTHNLKSADDVREQLIKILGEESIGFWAIMDQILFLEGIIDEISTTASD